MDSRKGHVFLLNLFQQLLTQQEEQASPFQKLPITEKTNFFCSPNSGIAMDNKMYAGAAIAIPSWRGLTKFKDKMQSSDIKMGVCGRKQDTLPANIKEKYSC